MRAANNDAELAADHLLSVNAPPAQSQNTTVPASSAAGAASVRCIESVEQVAHVATASHMSVARPSNRWLAVRRKASMHGRNNSSG
jgi:hypothetical protein